MPIDTDSLNERLNELPSLPLIVQRVHQGLCDPHASLKNVAKMIETDHAMTARLLRAANSAQYGLIGKVDNVARALTVIGSGEALNLVLATSVISAFRDLPIAGLSMRSFWEHGLACAVAARTIATLLDLNQPERYYLAGLLHDIGRLPLSMLEPQAMGALLRAHGAGEGPLWALERQAFGMAHPELGAMLLERWNLPAFYRQAILHHASTADAWPLEAAITHVADLMVNALRLGQSGTTFVPALDAAAWNATGLSVADLPTLVATTLTVTRDVIAEFEER